MRWVRIWQSKEQGQRIWPAGEKGNKCIEKHTVVDDASPFFISQLRLGFRYRRGEKWGDEKDDGKEETWCWRCVSESL